MYLWHRGWLGLSSVQVILITFYMLLTKYRYIHNTSSVFKVVQAGPFKANMCRFEGFNWIPCMCFWTMQHSTLWPVNDSFVWLYINKKRTCHMEVCCLMYAQSLISHHMTISHVSPIKNIMLLITLLPVTRRVQTDRIWNENQPTTETWYPKLYKLTRHSTSVMVWALLKALSNSFVILPWLITVAFTLFTLFSTVLEWKMQSLQHCPPKKLTMIHIIHLITGPYVYNAEYI